jgi:DNA-binding HxlR family transcriptional regulator
MMKRMTSSCPAERTVQLIGGRWKVVILWFLLQQTMRFSDLRRSIIGISQKMLTQQLRELERDGIVQRTVYRQVPPKVEYSLTSLGRSLKPIAEAMHQWGVKHAKGNDWMG